MSRLRPRLAELAPPEKNMSISSVQLLDQQPHERREHPCECRQHQRCASRLSNLEGRLWDIVVNVAGLEQFHQCKGHDETDGRPFEASQRSLKHPAQMLAQATTALNSESPPIGLVPSRAFVRQERF